jgi:hypothetical protein
LRPPQENGFKPIETESFHKTVVELAERNYNDSGAPHVDVNVSFLDEERAKQENRKGWLCLTDKRTGSKREKMARSLSEFVKTHWPAASEVITFKKRAELPVGFEVITIASPLRGSWYSGESGSMGPLVYQDLAAKIEEKNRLFDKYRANLLGCPIWLIIYSGPSIAEGVPIPCMDDWRFSFAFDKVLLFSGMDNRVFEIMRN